MDLLSLFPIVWLGLFHCYPASSSAASSFSNLPVDAHAAIVPFTIQTQQEVLDDLRTLVSSSKLAIPTFENTRKDGEYGVAREWMQTIKEKWVKFDWLATEQRLNQFPHFKASVQDDDDTQYMIHFVALFSKKADATPVIMLHGWPGSFLEFISLLQLLKDKYTPETLPYHVIVPSLPGYAFSSGPPIDKNFGVNDASRLLDRLMSMLGFGHGYIAQGGDIGSRVARTLGERYPSCKAVHVNFLVVPNAPPGTSEDQLSAADKQGLARAREFLTFGIAYALEHATRPSTIGFVLASNPMALMAWIGEKFQDWSDVTPSEETIIEFVTLYWITNTIERSVYPYREDLPEGAQTLVGFLSNQSMADSSIRPAQSETSKDQTRLGFSSFPKEILFVPESWARASTNLVWFRKHDKGGHFAALEQPEVLLQDVEDFVAQEWKK